MKDTLYLVDGSSYIFRAYYAIKQDLTNDAGVKTNAVFGFKNMMAQLYQEKKPTHLTIVFDAPGNNFRHDLYPEYKANRSEAPEDLKPQFALIREYSKLLNIPVIVPTGVEADDMLASLAEKFSSEIPVIIVSSDKDLTQLVNERVSMFDTMKRITYNPQKVEEKFGVPPDKISQFLALMGDASDNIPGAQGVGAKTAVKLLQEYGDFAGIEANMSAIKGKLGEKIRDSWDKALLSLRLTEVKRSLPIDLTLENFRVPSPDLEGMQSFYNNMNFKLDPFLKNYLQKEDRVPSSNSVDRSAYILITKISELKRIVSKIQEEKQFCFDLETTSLVTHDARIVGIGLVCASEPAMYVPVAHKTELTQIALEEALQALQPLFDNSEISIIGQNIKYDISVLKNYGKEIQGKLEDTMLQSYLLNSSAREHSLDDLASKYLQHAMISYEEIVGKGSSQLSFDQVELDKALSYAAEDVDVTRQLHEILRPQITEKGLEKIYFEIEIPICRLLAEIEYTGVMVHAGRLQEFSKQLQDEARILEEEIYALAGERFNLNSPKQMGAVLFEKLGIEDYKKKTKTGYSTDASILEKLAPRHEIAHYILGYRGKTKLINTYLEVLPKAIHPQTGRVHTYYHQAVAATGRLSSQHPNLQNIPIRGEDGNRVRMAFIAQPGHILMAADYSQIELRLLACISRDEALLKAFVQREDIHQQTACAILNISPEEMTPDDRRIAKTINFGIIYGMGAFRLSQVLNISIKQAKMFIDAYFKKYPKILSYMEETKKEAENTGIVKTLFGRIRPIPGINAQDHRVKSGAERVAINSRIQGSAADIIKMSMLSVNQAMKEQQLCSKMIMQVHDELVFEVVENEVEIMKKLLKEHMENVCPDLPVPLEVSIGTGENWHEAHA